VIAGREQARRAAVGGRRADDKQPDGALGDRGVLFVTHRAAGVVDDGDRTFDRLRAVVASGAAGRLLWHQCDRVEPAGRRGDEQGSLVDVIAAPANRQRRVAAFRAVEPLELRGLDVKTLVLQYLHDVVRAGVVAGRPFGAAAFVSVGDFLQLAQMRVHAV